MKRLLLFFGLLITLQGISQNVNIPDANFKAYLVGNSTINTNGDTEIQLSEANSFTGSINCSSRNISSLIGIEEFTNIWSLHCNFNQITSLDLTNNLQLIVLNCYTNQITNLDISNNSNLTHINCSGNQITNLDVSNSPNLKNLLCHYNQLASINTTNNTLLEALNCNENQISVLDVSNNLSLETIFCSGNQIVNIDLSTHVNLTNLRCSNNELETLNIKNGFNTNMNNNFFDIRNNPDLTCVTVDNATYSNANWSLKDFQTNYGLNCSSCIVNIPDVNFKNALLNHTPTIDTDGDGEIQCSEAIAVTGLLNVASKNILNTTGLEAFVNITRLAMFDNDIQNIDLSSNVLLEQLLLENNNLTAIDISILPLLTDFKAHSNLLANANVANGNNSNMTRMQLQGNTPLTCIQIDNNFTPPTNGSWLKDNTANFSFNCGPCIVFIPDTNFKNAILNHTTTIDTNNDGEIQCTEAIAVTGLLNAANENIMDTTGLEAFVNITRLAMFGNSIQNIDVSSNLSLEQLLLEDNNLTTIDISMLSSLRDFKAHSNQLTSANVANGNNSNMTRMQLQGNPSLTCIKIDTGFTPPISGTWLKDTTANYTTSCPQYPIANNSSTSNGTNEMESTEESLIIYPNPTTDIVYVKVNETIKTLSLINTSGIKLITENETDKLDLSELKKGFYWLVIKTETQEIKKRIIKE